MADGSDLILVISGIGTWVSIDCGGGISFDAIASFNSVALFANPSAPNALRCFSSRLTSSLAIRFCSSILGTARTTTYFPSIKYFFNKSSQNDSSFISIAFIALLTFNRILNWKRNKSIVSVQFKYINDSLLRVTYIFAGVSIQCVSDYRKCNCFMRTGLHIAEILQNTSLK